jgi:general secretion pathway protein J
MKTPARSARAGFTLIEVMMAFAVFSLLIASIYACWTLVIRSAQIGQEAAAQVQRERRALRTIKEALGCVLSFQADPYNYAFLAENNNNGYLSFAARVPETFPRYDRPAWRGFDVRRVEFSIENGADYSERQLVLRQTPLLKEMHPDERSYPFVVAKDVNKFEMQFWDDKKRDWVDEWTRTNEIPPQLKIKLEFLRRNNRDPYAQPVKAEVVDIAKLPAIMVPSNFQAPGGPGQPPPGAGQIPPGGVPPGGGIRPPGPPGQPGFPDPGARQPRR